jgi:hypothetical protein
MAQIKPEPIVEHLGSQIRRALEDAVRSVVPNAEFDSYELYRAFLNGVLLASAKPGREFLINM